VALGSVVTTSTVIRAVDPLTVEVVTTEPWATFDRVLAGVPGYMAAPSMLESEEAATNPVGTGPFQFDEWVQDSNFVASKWERYWQTDDEGRQLPYLNEIEYQIIVDDQSRMAALESGDVDLILTTDADDVKAAREMDDVVSVEDNFTEETFVMLNTGQAPFDNPNAREALAYGTDVEALIQTVGADITIAAESPWAEGTPWHVEDHGYVEYDPVRAQQAVDAYVDETGQPLEFDLAGIAQVSVTQVQELLVEQWRQLGIAANIDTLEQTAYISNIATGDFEAAWFRNYSYWDPDNKYVFMHSKFANGVGELSINFTQVSNDELDDLLDRGRQSGDPDERREIYAEVARLWNEQLTNIWLFQTPFALIGRAEVRGLNPTREDGFGNLQPKPWIGGLWLDE
jgi:peptide/nickel transport system substrate-binding protein